MHGREQERRTADDKVSFLPLKVTHNGVHPKRSIRDEDDLVCLGPDKSSQTTSDFFQLRSEMKTMEAVGIDLNDRVQLITSIKDGSRDCSVGALVKGVECVERPLEREFLPLLRLMKPGSSM